MFNHEKFKYFKKIFYGKNEITYEWYIVDPEKKRGCHFHGRKVLLDSWKGRDKGNNEHDFMTFGLEVHSPVQLYDFADTPIKNCQVTGGDCYCDGTGLGASEQLGWVNPDNPDHEIRIWQVLERFYFDFFARHDNENE